MIEDAKEFFQGMQIGKNTLKCAYKLYFFKSDKRSYFEEYGKLPYRVVLLGNYEPRMMPVRIGGD